MNYFQPHELKCSCGECYGTMNLKFMIRLNKLRNDCNFPFHISSAYRCGEYNEKIGGAKNSAHKKGRAVDILCSHKEALIIIVRALEYGFTGIGVKQRGNGRFIHIDDTHETPTLWSY